MLIVTYQNYHIIVAVHGSTDADSLFLTTAQVDSFLSNLSLVTSWENVYVRLQGARSYHRLVPGNEQEIMVRRLYNNNKYKLAELGAQGLKLGLNDVYFYVIHIFLKHKSIWGKPGKVI